MSATATADIVNAVLTSHDGSKTEDIAGYIDSFEINQSMHMMGYKGSIRVLDKTGVFETFPIRCEERLQLKIISDDLGTEYNLKTRVYKIDNFAAGESGGGLMYTIHFMSSITYESAKRSIITSFRRNSMDQIARRIFDKYFAKLGERDYLDAKDKTRTLEYAAYRNPIIDEPERNFILQPTANITNCVIPDYIPQEAMNFLTSLSFQPETPSSSFKFFETLDNFYFATDEYFIKTARRNDLIDLFYAPASSIDPRNPYDQINRVESLDIASRGMDVGSAMMGGGYRSSVLEVDLVKKTINNVPFNYDEDAKYIDMTGEIRRLEDDPHTAKFREETFTEENAPSFIVYKDYNSNGEISRSLNVDRFLPSITSNRLSYGHHLNQTTVQAIMKGRLDIQPGMIVNLEVQNMDAISRPEKNKTLSGKYLVDTTKHSRDNSGTLNTALKLLKFGWSKGDVDV